MPWSVMRGERAPTEPWTTRDRRLAVALTQLEASLCSGCGQPSWLTYDASLTWEVDDEPYRCIPCTAQSKAVSKWTSDGEEVEAPDALRWAPPRVYDPDAEAAD